MERLRATQLGYRLTWMRGRQTIVYRLSSIVFACWLLTTCSPATPAALPTGQSSAVQSAGGIATAGFARAIAPREFVFPQDHGSHPEYAIEWWYYTGNLDTAQGRHFGYQLTFFRIGLTPTPAARASDCAASNIYMAHFALTDVANQKFYAFERFSRGAAGLAGAQGQPFRVWLEDWDATGAGADGLPMRLQAAQDDVAIDLTLEGGKPIVLQGDRGLSQKSDRARQRLVLLLADAHAHARHDPHRRGSKRRERAKLDGSRVEHQLARRKCGRLGLAGGAAFRWA